MYSAILNRLCCPKCRRNLDLRADIVEEEDVITGVLTCENGHTFRIDEGVADFNSEEQGFANQWEAMDEERSFDELSREMDARNPAEIVQRQKMVLDAIVNAVADRSGKVVLDIASGRGLLLTEIAKRLNDDVQIISIDLSAYVLKHDRKKLKSITSNRKISYLACDASNLPLKDDAVDAAVTYCGFSNMLGCAKEALQDACRVVKVGGVLVDSYVVIREPSDGYKQLRAVCAEQGIIGAEDFFLYEGISKHHEALFSAVDCNVVFEGIGVGNGMDLLPYDGEWYAEQVFISEK